MDPVPQPNTVRHRLEVDIRGPHVHGLAEDSVPELDDRSIVAGDAQAIQDLEDSREAAQSVFDQGGGFAV